MHFINPYLEIGGSNYCLVDAMHGVDRLAGTEFHSIPI